MVISTHRSTVRLPIVLYLTLSGYTSSSALGSSLYNLQNLGLHLHNPNISELVLMIVLSFPVFCFLSHLNYNPEILNCYPPHILNLAWFEIGCKNKIERCMSIQKWINAIWLIHLKFKIWYLFQFLRLDSIGYMIFIG